MPQVNMMVCLRFHCGRLHFSRGRDSVFDSVGHVRLTQDLDLQFETTCSPRRLDESGGRSPLLIHQSGEAGGFV